MIVGCNSTGHGSAVGGGDVGDGGAGSVRDGVRRRVDTGRRQ